jgi:CYTH domain-containing protein
MTKQTSNKFSPNHWQKLATHRTCLRQAYLASNGKASIRIRIKGDGAATLTIKSRPLDLRRLELEYDIPVLEAEALRACRAARRGRRKSENCRGGERSRFDRSTSHDRRLPRGAQGRHARA